MRIDEFIGMAKLKSLSVVDNEGKHSGAEILADIDELIKVFIGNNITSGDRIAIISENSASFIVSMLAVFMVNAVAVLIDPNVPPKTILDYLSRAEVKLLLLTAETKSKFSTMEKNEAGGERRRFYYISGSERYYRSSPKDTAEAFVLFSSGTTGVAKGVILTHDGVISNVKAILSYMRPTSEDVFYITKTAVHVSTLIGELLIGLYVGASIVIMNPRIPPSLVLKYIDKYRVTIIGVNPTILNLLVKASKVRTHDLNSVRAVYTSGAVASKTLLSEAAITFKSSNICNVYGLTEAGTRVSAQRFDGFKKYGSVGMPLDGIELKIINDQGMICKPDEMGEIYVRTPSMMKGYLGNQRLTDEKINDSWLRTNDLGYLDQDGELFVVGRKDDMINRGAYKIDPGNIESIIHQYSGVEEAVVFGCPDEIYGQKIVCVFTTDNSTKKGISAVELNAYCQQYLMQIEIPQIFVEWNSIPKTNTGKLSRQLVRERFSKMGKCNEKI
jgi:long-chain acyl-CoA synthetase